MRSISKTSICPSMPSRPVRSNVTTPGRHDVIGRARPRRTSSCSTPFDETRLPPCTAASRRPGSRALRPPSTITLQRREVPVGQLRLDHHLGGAAGDEHVAPEVAEAAVPARIADRGPHRPRVRGPSSQSSHPARTTNARDDRGRVRDPDRLARSRSSRRPARRGVALAERRSVRHPQDVLAVHHQREQGRPDLDAGREVPRAVDRVDDPAPAPPTLRSRPPRRGRRRPGSARRTASRIISSIARSASVTGLRSAFHVTSGPAEEGQRDLGPPRSASSSANASSSSNIATGPPRVPRAPRP